MANVEKASVRFKRRVRDRNQIWLLFIIVTALITAERFAPEYLSLWSWVSSTIDGFWNWYAEKFLLYPKRAAITPLLLLSTGTTLWALKKAAPTWGQARRWHAKMDDYFWLDTAYWYVMYVQLPISLVSFVFDLSIWIEPALATTALVLVAFAVIKIALRIREANHAAEEDDDKSEMAEISKVAALAAPALALTTPTIGGLLKVARGDDQIGFWSAMLIQAVEYAEGWLRLIGKLLLPA